jgi:serine/threonine protein kinase
MLMRLMAGALLPGTRIGPYDVTGPIGAGGMGEVYRARDSRLDRDVAIKILPSSFALDEDRLRRFEREARILASLNHRHIAGIYGVEDLGGSKALVLEFVDGVTLAERIARGPLDLHETLTIAQQIADGVETAHEQGIIHRDLKPANIKVRSDGTVKVLDFGLARADTNASEMLDAATITAEVTREGTTLGTAAYMSPEQARGRQVDRRTDIWAFGCVLFEMLSRRRAFEADGSTDTLAKVLQREPDWSLIPADTPPGIRDLVVKCLQKDQRQRLRDIGDARITIEETLRRPHEDTATSGTRVRPRRFTTPAMLVVAALAGAALTYALVAIGPARTSEEPAPFDRFVRLVASTAHEFSPAISPDGKWVAYLSNARGPTDIWVKSIAGGDPVNLTAGIDLEVQTQDTIGGLEVSPDGTQLAFIAAPTGTPAARFATYLMPMPLGGTPRRLMEGQQGMRWSPDGKRITFIKPGGSYGDSLFVADSDGQNEREIVKHSGAYHIHQPRWSADGRAVYFNYGFHNGNNETTQIFKVSVEGGPPEPVVKTARRAVAALPSPDGRYLLFAANPDDVDANLWQRDLSTGRDRRLTFGLGEYDTPSISADGRRLVAAVSDVRQALVRVRVSFDKPPALERLSDGYEGDVHPCWSPDGTRIVFSSSRSGSRNIWWSREDLSHPVALTTWRAMDDGPVYSPDGSQVAFVSDQGGRRGIWVVSADGGTPRLIAASEVLLNALSWSRDGKRLVYSAPGGELPQIEVVEVSTGKITRLPTSASANSPVWSPVEDIIAYVETQPGVGGYIRFMTGDGRPLVRGPEDKVTALNNGFIRWSPDGKRLAGIGIPGNRRGYIWIIEPLAAVPFRKLVDLPPDTYPRGATWAADGSEIIFGDSRRTADIVMAERTK